jgi:hypothetical protein
MAKEISSRAKSNSAMGSRRIRSDKTSTTGTTPRLGNHLKDKGPATAGLFFFLFLRCPWGLRANFGGRLGEPKPDIGLCVPGAWPLGALGEPSLVETNRPPPR